METNATDMGILFSKLAASMEPHPKTNVVKKGESCEIDVKNCVKSAKIPAF